MTTLRGGGSTTGRRYDDVLMSAFRVRIEELKDQWQEQRTDEGEFASNLFLLRHVSEMNMTEWISDLRSADEVLSFADNLHYELVDKGGATEEFRKNTTFWLTKLASFIRKVQDGYRAMRRLPDGVVVTKYVRDVYGGGLSAGFAEVYGMTGLQLSVWLTPNQVGEVRNHASRSSIRYLEEFFGKIRRNRVVRNECYGSAYCELPSRVSSRVGINAHKSSFLGFRGRRE